MEEVKPSPSRRFEFPQWANYLLPLLVLGALGAGPYVGVLWIFAADAETLNVGYRPEQPVPYSHQLHVGELGMDCRYCHTTVWDASFAAIPHTDVCIHCHNPDAAQPGIKKDSPQLKAVHDSYRTGMPIEWTWIHDLPDYVYFSHQAHVTKGVSCVECHGRVDKMDEEGVFMAKPLSMGWCLECHRAPEEHLRPVDMVTKLDWTPLDDAEVRAAGITDPAEGQRYLGEKLKKRYRIHDEAYMTACSTCHR